MSLDLVTNVVFLFQKVTELIIIHSVKWNKLYLYITWQSNVSAFYFANKGLSSQSYVFPSSHVWIWELDYKESHVPKNSCFWTEVLENTLESPLDCKEIQIVHPKGNQSRIFVGRTDAEAETPILWPPDVTNWLLEKDLNAGKDWRREEKGTTEDEMVGWHHWLVVLEFEWCGNQYSRNQTPHSESWGTQDY